MADQPSNPSSTNQPQGQEQVQNAEHVGFDDLEMLQYEINVKEQDSLKFPLVSKTELLTNLIKEYQNGSQVYVTKIQELSKKCKFLRRCRGDGNCFYRAFAFSLFEKVMLSDKSTFITIINKLKESYQMLLSVGYESIAIEDFYTMTLDSLKNFEPVSNRTKSTDLELTLQLVSLFEHDESANAIIMYFRLITSAYLKKNSDDYLPFLLDNPVMFNVPYNLEPIDHYRRVEVEVMNKESDEIHIILISKYFNVSLQVAYLDGHINSTNDEVVNFHKYPDYDENVNQLFSKDAITLLYRPGHYDILYRAP